MQKTKLRRIRINNEYYLWKRSYYHLSEFKHSSAVEKVIIYLENHKKSPLHLHFKEEDNLNYKDISKEKWCVGYPDTGVIWLYKVSPTPASNVIHINLNRPAVIASLIQYFIQNAWYPKDEQKPLIVEDALKLLDKIALPNGIN